MPSTLTDRKLCSVCHTQLLKIVPDDTCGFCRAGHLTTAIADLARRAPKSTQAVWYLREQVGCTKEMVARIRAEVLSGRSVDEIAAVVEQVLARQGVAALGGGG